MWSAFMNGSGLHGGGSGYVPSQGWEFVPCSRMERTDRGRGRSPLRRISSPPTVFSQIFEPQFSASVGVGGEGGGGGGGEGGSGSQLEILRGQMWSGNEAQQPQTQHSRLKKKFEDLKKRHVQDKEDWLREKESLLREVADIQGGENRRILLDLKTVLEEVQVEVKKEEEKRSELQLQYTRDRCAWELEKAELKCRIAQLEARDVTGLVSGGLQAAGSPREQHGETPTHRREREEQRRILADTQSAAMDLRCRLEHNERDWLKEKAELLERFDVERLEWESQLKDMQKKIEELYSEMKTKRGGSRLDIRRQDDEEVAQRLSIRSISTGSSLLSDISRSEPFSCSPSEPNTHLLAFNPKSNISGDGDAPRDAHNNCFQPDNLCEINVGAYFPQSEHSQPGCEDELRSRGHWQKDSIATSKEMVDTTELDAMFVGAPGCRGSQDFTSKKSEKSVSVSSQGSPVWSSLSYSSDKKKNTTALNAALKEIARVSEELCSYQDEIRKKSEDNRSRSESEKDQCDLNQIYNDFRALEKENWINVTPDNTWQADRRATESWTTSIPDPDSYSIMQMSLGLHSEMDPSAPPIPPRTSSWNLSSPTNPDTELHIPDSPITTVRKCHSPCILMDRKGSSPSIVRKFGAMLQENEGKVLIDGMIASCSVPANSNCNTGCCHNRWSCDASKFSTSKLSTYGTVQKSFSEVNIRSASKDLHSDYSPCVGNIQIPPFVRELPIDLLLSSLETAAVSSNVQGSKRNIMLEKKTAEFNRTLFQAEMGRGVEEQDSFSSPDACSAGPQSGFETPPNRNTDMQPERVLSLSMSNISIQNPELLPRSVGCPTEEVQIKQETQPVLPLEQVQAGLSKGITTSPLSPVQPSEIKHKVQTPSSPSRKMQNRLISEAPFCETSNTNTQSGQSLDDSNFKKESLHGAKPLLVGGAVSVQQSSSENKQRQMTRQVSAPSYPLDSSKALPRMMTEHPWKPLTLAAYPKPEGSRSNYGAVERILKNYENAAREQQAQQNERTSSTNISLRQEADVTELDSLTIDPMHLPPSLRHTQTSHYSETHTSQLSSHSTTSMEEIQLIVQEDDDPPASPSSVQKNFSRPARPAKRRLPSRWASRSTSSSPPSTPTLPPSFAHQKHSDSFTYSHAFHIETVII